ncbi:hypothetical protein CIPAW_02G017300 [Carya illinoinensis]|uniref:Uncharacterized protein n=1 Tax=Carya illinoinensis TaxID=32201 RepID=A0A8T1R8S4_CARIL|nr:hypothetical protein CIPAW_02G017300 [Carya illinoinensis]
MVAYQMKGVALIHQPTLRLMHSQFTWSLRLQIPLGMFSFIPLKSTGEGACNVGVLVGEDLRSCDLSEAA